MNKFLGTKPSTTLRAKMTQFFGFIVLGFMLVGSPLYYLHAEEAKADSPSAIAAVSVNVNSASVNELAEALIGIGVNKAQAIVEYRDQNGPFTDKSQLLNIKGIGKATLDKNRSVITLN